MHRHRHFGLSLLLAGCSLTPVLPTTHDLSVAIRLENRGPVLREGGGCSGTGDDAWMQEGVLVLLTDDSSRVVGSARLTSDPTYLEVDSCRYAFTFRGFASSPRYTIDIGGRVVVEHRERNLEDLGWVIDWVIESA